MRSILVLLLATGTAAAQPVTKHPRQAAVPRARAIAQPPSIRLDEVLASTLRGPIRAEQEPILVNLIQATPDSEVEEKADYLFRLGELYARQEQFWRDKAADNQSAQKAKEYLLKAVKIYKMLVDVDRFRNFPKLDLALFEYAYTLQSAKYLKEARAVYDRLIKLFPSSKYVMSAHVAFADYFFEAGQFADAEARYRQVLETPSNVQLYGRYKLALTMFATKRDQDAVEILTSVATSTDPAQRAVIDAAKRDLAGTMVERAYSTHAAWATSHDPDQLARAESLYTGYLTAVTDRGDLAYYYAELEWAHADLEPDAKQRPARWQRAAEAFQAAESDDPQRRRDIARAALLAWENALDIGSPEAAAGPIDLTKAARTKLAVKEIAGRDKQVMDACAAFVSVALPSDPDVATAKLVEALIDRRNDHADDAVAVLADLVNHHRAAETAEVATNLWLEQLLRLHRFDDVLALVDQLAADTAFIATKPTLQANIQLLRSRSMR